jgi:hypothetical protein
MLTHLRTNAVAYLALAIAVGTGTSYAATSLANGSVTTKKIHNAAVTSAKIKNRTIKSADLDPKAFDYLQSSMPAGDSPATFPDLVSVAPYDFTLPRGGRAYISVFLPQISAAACGGSQPSIGLYIDNAPIPTTKATVPLPANARSMLISVTYPLAAGAHAGRLGITCNGSGTPSGINTPGQYNWTVGVIGN